MIIKAPGKKKTRKIIRIHRKWWYALLKLHITLFSSMTHVRKERREELVIWTALTVVSARSLYSVFMSALTEAGRGKKKGEKKENHNKKTTKCSTNPAVNESGSLQQFFYALSIPQGDKHNAEPAPSATSPTPLHCKHCGLPHFMSVNPFKPTGNYSSQSGQRTFRWRNAPSGGHNEGPPPPRSCNVRGQMFKTLEKVWEEEKKKKRRCWFHCWL